MIGGKKKTFSCFLDLFANAKKLRESRREIVGRLFWEAEHRNTDQFVDQDSRIKKFLHDKKSLPNSFLVSDLGFKRANINGKIVEFLQKFNLEKKPSTNTFRVGIHYFVLKSLLLKYFSKN